MNQTPLISTFTILSIVAGIAIGLPAGTLTADAAEPAKAAPTASVSRAEEVFTHKVLPIFREKCFACHGADADDIRGEFNMLSLTMLLRGGESGEPSIVPGKPGSSPLFEAVKWNGLEMPPKENDRLTAEQIEFVREWIAGGAPWPDESRLAEIVRTTADRWNVAGGVRVSTSGGLSEEWTNRRYAPENLWSWQPLWRDPSDRLKDHSRNAIDALIDERAETLGVPLALLADRLTLIRRVTFDLIGLPPTSSEMRSFLDDPASDADAFATVVDRLLASPHYGEQWARHWLDVVRYADSSGYANDYERGNTWRYRDYVVRSFNTDKSYARFITEQLAGDEIVEQRAADGHRSVAEYATDAELLIAVGFLRMGPWELTGMEVPKVARQRFLDDVTDSVGQVFLGHMLQCAKCHDHKFDPLPTRDYYSMQAVFATTQFAERPAAFLPEENTSGFEEKKYLEQRRSFCQKTLQELEKKRNVEAARHWFRENRIDSAPFEAVVAELAKVKQRPAGEVPIKDIRELMAERKIDPALIPPRHVGFEPRDFGMERVARKGIERLGWRMRRYEPVAFSAYDGRTPSLKSVQSPLKMPENRLRTGELEETAILTGGDPFSPAVRVSPGILSVVEGLSAANEETDPNAARARPVSTKLPTSVTGRRLALAQWIASSDNPLTARVMVNRIWQWHFGKPIAGNPNNFGTTGRKPSHPRLLDWLARQFIESGWSIKHVHRLILSSHAYRRSSTHPAPDVLSNSDPDGTSFAVFQPRRLDAEELRDAMLFCSGELNPIQGGIPIRPEMNLEAALQPRMVMGSFAEAWQPSPLPEQRHRRSLYALRIRGLRDPFLEVFNAPGSDLSCEAREGSTVTPQVFAMFNSKITFERALALAQRLHDETDKPSTGETGSPNERSRTSEFSRESAVINRAFDIVYGRAASDDELSNCLAHWKHMTARHRTLKFEPTKYPTQIARDAVEENTGESFTFTEPLEFYAEFVPDLKPADASPELRGLAEVCLVLLNSNEFAHVY